MTIISVAFATIFLIILLFVVLSVYLDKSIKIVITHKQEFTESDRQLLEDLYNQNGDPKDAEALQDSFDEMVKTVNSIMLDEENTNG